MTVNRKSSQDNGWTDDIWFMLNSHCQSSQSESYWALFTVCRPQKRALRFRQCTMHCRDSHSLMEYQLIQCKKIFKGNHLLFPLNLLHHILTLNLKTMANVYSKITNNISLHSLSNLLENLGLITWIVSELPWLPQLLRMVICSSVNTASHKMSIKTQPGANVSQRGSSRTITVFIHSLYETAISLFLMPHWPHSE